MQPTDMSIMVHSFARLRYRDRAMMSRIAEAPLCASLMVPLTRTPRCTCVF